MAKKIILIVLGLLLLIPGVGLAVADGGLLALGGRSGTVQSGFHAVETPTSALVSDAANVNKGSDVRGRGSVATLTIAARSSAKSVFVGVGPSAEVTQYLTGSSYAEVSDIDLRPFKMTTRVVPGTGVPPSPESQSFWLAKASGTAPEVDWKVSDGDYRVVVMNADGSAGVNTELRLGMKIPALFGIGLGTLLAGFLLSLLALGLILWGILAKRRPPAQPTDLVPPQPLEVPGFPPR